jgi:signal transduction histidine kinase
MKMLRPAHLAWIAQAALIVLPVAILSGVALHFLHEDRAAIERDAKDRAWSLGQETARRIGEQVNAFLNDGGKNGRFVQARIINGRAVPVPYYSRWPEPTDWVAKLPPREAQLWQTAQDATFRQLNAETANRALVSLTEANNSAPVRANAQLSLLIAAEPHSNPAPLIERAIAIAKDSAGEVTESGTPVSDLALLLALRHVAKGNLPQDLVTAIGDNLSRHPSWLSPALLDAVAAAATTDADKTTAARLRADWQREEANRENVRSLVQPFADRLWYLNAAAYRTHARLTSTLLLYRNSGKLALNPNSGKIVSPPDGLAFCSPHSWGWQVTLVQLSALRQAIHISLPDYMGAALRVNGERLDLDQRRATKPLPLAYANGSFSLDTAYPFQLVLDLRKPDLLYATYRRRLVLIQWLILAAVASALLGLWRLWQTWRDQTRLNEMKSNLVSSVSHELRAPIAAVRLMAESLESSRVDGEEKRKDYYRLIVRECARLSSLVENVLDFSRIDQGRKQYHFEPLDALALLRHTVMLMEPGAAERRVRLRLVDPPTGFEELQPSWDSEAIEQSLVNLLDNAIKHSAPADEVRVEVELLPAFLRFWVVDSGPGIPPEEHHKIFDLFYRYGSELRRETEGAGIGLSIVKHAAEAHGGRVIVESSVGQGSRFGLELPR